MKYLGSIWPKAATAAACGALVLACVVVARGDDWPGFLGAQRDGSSVEAGWSVDWQASAPKKLWECQVGQGYSCASISGGRAYTMGHANDADTVFCLDAVTGKEVWKKSYPCKSPGYPGPRCSPAIDGDRVYTVSVEGHIKCWNAADGSEIWSRQASEFGGKANGWGFAGSPLVLGEKLIVDVGAAAAMDKKTGKDIWKTPPYKAGYSSPKAFRAGGRDLVAVFGGDELKVLAAGEGTLVAATPWKTGYDTNAAVPVISGDEIYVTTSYNHGGAKFKLEGQKLVQVWENKDMASQFATPVLVGGYLYGVSGNVNDGPVRCLDFKDGLVKWSAPGSGSLILVDGKLVILGSKGRLAVAQASPEGYKELGSTDLGTGDWWNAPVLANGLIYCRSHEGKLICLDVRK